MFNRNIHVSCVANLGNTFAIGPSSLSIFPSPSTNPKIDIYEFPDKLKQTFTEHISGLERMASTPDGKLTVLCDKGVGEYCVQIFDPETGYIRSTPTFLNKEGGILSFDVTARHEYVVLLGGTVTMVRDDGSVVLKQNVREASPWRVSCGGKFVFISSPDQVGAWKNIGTISTDRGPKVASLVARSSCGRCAQHLRPIRASGVNRAHVTRKCCAQNSRTMCVM
jgi:hypothetical protein